VYLYVTRPAAPVGIGPTKVGAQTSRGVSFVPGTLSGTF
jgi:hypothetical protein